MTQNINQKSENRNQKQIRNSKIETVSNFSFRASSLFRTSSFEFLISRYVFRICFVFLISNFVFSATPVAAQNVSLSISPPVVEILLAPGKKVEQTFTLQTTGENLAITPELHLATPSDSQGHMTIDPNPLVPSSIPLTFKITGPSSMPTLTFEAANIDVPTDIYLALVFKVNPAGSPEANDSRASPTLPAISALILVTINPGGLTPIDLAIKNFSPPALHDSYLPLTLSPLLHNNTSIMIRPEGLYEIISPLGKTVLSLPLYPNLILGNSSRSLQSTINHQPSTIIWSPTWRNLGPHTLRLTITTAGGTQITQLEKTIWLLPLTGIIIVLIFIIILLTLFFKRTKFKTV